MAQTGLQCDAIPRAGSDAFSMQVRVTKTINPQTTPATCIAHRDSVPFGCRYRIRNRNPTKMPGSCSRIFLQLGTSKRASALSLGAYPELSAVISSSGCIMIAWGSFTWGRGRHQSGARSSGQSQLAVSRVLPFSFIHSFIWSYMGGCLFSFGMFPTIFKGGIFYDQHLLNREKFFTIGGCISIGALGSAYYSRMQFSCWI